MKLYNSDREWFWPNNDSAASGQLCFSNASLVAFLTTRVRAIMKKQPNTTLLSISVMDDRHFCQTPTELAIIAEECGSLINTIGAAVEVDFRQLTLVTLAYLAFTPPPKTAPRRNVAVRVCSVSCDFGRPLSDPTNGCDGFKSDLADWVALANSGSGGGKIWTWNYEPDDRTVGHNVSTRHQQYTSANLCKLCFLHPQLVLSGTYYLRCRDGSNRSPGSSNAA